MAKETTIIFVYDTQKLQREEDDPASAILYFHPTWVSDQQKTALCGQIIGTVQCVKNLFSKPKIVSLQTGKFFIFEKGKYLLAVGTDRNITDWFLEYRANMLYALVAFFHKDFDTLSNLYTNNTLSAKLYHIFETYLKMLVFGGNIFSHIPSLALPKSASNVFMEAIHILECCQEMSHVLGGLMLYHNKVVATQLSPDLTKKLILSDPYRIKCPAETVEVTYDLPLGVQLLQIYISNREYCKLFEISERNRSTFQYLKNKSLKKNILKNAQVLDTTIVSAMKRDQSLIFTAVPEEGSDHNDDHSDYPFIPTTKKNRPKFLNLKSISIDEHVEKKSSKQTITTPLCGQISICSTPMTELKKFVYQNPLSICTNKSICENSSSLLNKSDEITEIGPYFTVSSVLCKIKQSNSLTNLNEIINSISKDSTQYFNFKQNFINVDLSPKKEKIRKRFKTITDPTFPVFKYDGTVVSRAYYSDYAKNNIELVKLDLKNEPKSNHYLVDTVIQSNTNDTIKTEKLLKLPMKNHKDQRKSLTLPLKSLSTDCESTTEVTLTRRCSSGVQLTPLLSKLSILAFEERSSGFCSKDTTPCDYRGFTPTQPSFSFPYSKYKNKDTKIKKIEDDTLQKCVLFVCGQQDIVLTILLGEGACQETNVVKKLWDICTEHLGKLEKQLSYCMETQSGASSHESEPYSYLCLDSKWGTTKRGGPWGTNDLGILNYLHRDFNENENITEILIRGGDSIIYGHNCGPTEVFYHESANTSSGLPPPADPMGLVQLKAKRRLERDHMIILL